MTHDDINAVILSVLAKRSESNIAPSSYVSTMKKFICIRFGDMSGIDAVNQEFRSTTKLLAGRLSDDFLRNTKYLFIATMTLASRIAIESGLDPDVSYILTDIFSKEMDKASKPEELYVLHHQMITEFVLRVKEAREKELSHYTKTAIEFIAFHINNKFTVTDICAYVGISNAELNHAFKEDLGYSVTQYVMNYKLEIAKFYLTYYDFSIAEIANLLHFSSQSHFTKAFHNKFGETPKKFREKDKILLNPIPE
jgi:AraC-like DNA-binding protein